MGNQAIVLILLLLAGTVVVVSSFPSVNEANAFLNLSNDRLNIRMYGQDGQLIGSSNGFSVVNGVAGVVEIDGTITVTNTGSATLTCTPSALSPSVFASATTLGPKTITAGQSVSWTSTKIQTSTLESLTQPVKFSASMTCTYTVGSVSTTLPLSTAFKDVTVARDVTGSFTMSVSAGGSSGSTGGTGGSGGSGTGNNVNFRTTDPTYSVTGSAIAYSATCGGPLIPFGFSSTSTSSASCAQRGDISQPALFNAPSTAGTFFVYKESNANFLDVCFNTAAGSTVRKYHNADSDISRVSTSITAVTAANEVAC